MTIIALLAWVWAMLRVHIDRAPGQGGANIETLTPWWIATATLWLALTWLIVSMCRRAKQEQSQASESRRSVTPRGGFDWLWRCDTLVILGVAVATRIAVLLTTTPQLSDDVWRYVHDGYTFARGENPYRYAPSEVAKGVEGRRTDQRINHPELVTLYLPASQWTFAALAKLQQSLTPASAEATFEHPAAVIDTSPAFRAAFILADIAIVIVLLHWLAARGASLWWAALYAWHPLPLSEVAATGHQDVLGIAPMLLVLYLAECLLKRRATGANNGSTAGASLDRGTPSRGADHARATGGLPASAETIDATRTGSRFKAMERAAIAGIATSVSLLVKPILLPLLLIVVWRLRKQPRVIATAATLAIAFGLLMTLPFVAMEGGILRMLETAGRFTRDWAFNSPVHAPLSKAIGAKLPVSLLVGGLLIALLWRLSRGRHSLATGALLFTVTVLFFSSTVHPWYLLWSLPLLPIVASEAIGRDGRDGHRSAVCLGVLTGTWAWSLSIGWSYAVLHDVQTYRVPIAVGAAEYGGVLLAGVAAWAWVRRGRGTGSRTDPRSVLGHTT